MSRKAAQTGPGPIMIVALEQDFPEKERILHDDLAYRILPLGMRIRTCLSLRLMSRNSLVKRVEKMMPGMWSGFLCRKRYIDAKITEATDGQIEMVVNLGAGFDTRGYRLPVLAKVPIWEVDQPDNIDAKRSRLGKVLEEIPAHVTLVPIDFDHQELGPVLASHGYAADRKTFFIWEAVTQYLTEVGIRTTLDFLANAPAGSHLVFTYVRKDFIDGKTLYDHTYSYKRFVLKEKSWLYGMDPEEVADFLAVYGWQVMEHLGYEELAEWYVKPTGRELLSTPLERMVYAKKL